MEKKIEVKINRVIKGGTVESRVPYYATDGAAGADLYACLEQDILIKPGERVKIPTGLAIELPMPGVVALVFARSGLAAKKGLALGNGVGVIDSDYRGEIMVLMVNLGQEDVVVHHEDRIAQMMFIPVYQAIFTEVANLEPTQRGEGGFGSTGTQ